MKNLSLMTAIPAFVLALGMASNAAAQSTWDLSTTLCDPTSNALGANTAGCAVGSTTASVTAWSNTGSGGKYARAAITDQGASGVGITSAGETTASPNHAIDNFGNSELVLLNFGTDKVSLSQLSTGWAYNDADVSVLRWNATTGPDLTTMTTSGTTDGLIAQGWQLVASGDVDGVTANNNVTFGTKTFGFTGGTSSSWWIISSYFGGNSGNLDAGNDYFKLLSFTGTCTGNQTGGACGTPPTSQIPEPASLALVGIALAGMVGARRRKSQG